MRVKNSRNWDKFYKIMETIEKMVIAEILEMNGSISDDRKAEIKEFAFHMSDWFDDCLNLAKFYKNPEKYSQKEVYDLMMSVMVHIPYHVQNAKDKFLAI